MVHPWAGSPCNQFPTLNPFYFKYLEFVFFLLGPDWQITLDTYISAKFLPALEFLHLWNVANVWKDKIKHTGVYPPQYLAHSRLKNLGPLFIYYKEFLCRDLIPRMVPEGNNEEWNYFIVNNDPYKIIYHAESWNGLKIQVKNITIMGWFVSFQKNILKS